MLLRPMQTFALAAFACLSTSAFAAEVLPVCERTAAVQEFIVAQINQDQGADKTCADITQSDLDSLLRVAVNAKGITAFKVGDFSGLPNLEILNIRSNPYTSLPEGLFQGLTNLQTLVIIATDLRNYPDDFLADTPNLRHCYCFRNQVRSISLSVLERLTQLTALEELEFDGTLQAAEKAYIEAAFPADSGVSLFFH